MRKREAILAAACATAMLQGTVLATITIDGSYDTDYGSAITLQTNNTQFGDSTSGDGTSAGGSELDGAYGVVQNGALNLLLTGNFENNGNKVNIFIADGRAGQNVINALPGGSNLNNMNGSKFSPGFSATYELDVNQFVNMGVNTVAVNQYDMTQASAPASFFGFFTPNTSGPSTLHGVTFSLNNTNAAGVNGTAPSAADPTAAGAVQTGLEISIPLSLLGSPNGGTINVMADINGGGNNFLSNQFLPGLSTVQGNVGNGGKFDFSGVPGMFFGIGVPATETVSIWNVTGSGSWSAAGNWSGGVPNAAAAVANFGSIITGAATVTLDGTETVGRILFNNANSYTIAPGSGTLTIDDTGDTLGVNPLIDVQLGNHTVMSPVAMANGVTVNTLDNTSLTMSGIVSGNGTITHSGAGKLVLSNANTFNGNLVSTAGTLELDNASAASSGSITLGDPDIDNLPATLALGSAVTTFSTPILTNRDLANNTNLRTVSTAGNTTISGPVTLQGSVVFAPAASTTVNVTGLIQNGGTDINTTYGIHASGAGTVILNNQEQNTGDVFVDSGTMVLATNASLQAGSINVFTGGTFVDNGLLSGSVKIYAQGTFNLPGNTTASPLPLSVGEVDIDDGGSLVIGHSTSSANPIQVAAGAVNFLNNTTGKIDLTNNQLSTTNDQNTVRQQLQFNNIITSTPGGTLGYKDDGNGTQIQFALGGDADLSGAVDTSDFMTMANNFGATGVFWTQGDFNYDGVVNALDFNELASNFGQTLPAPALGTLVPEPATMSLLLLPLIARRRRLK